MNKKEIQAGLRYIKNREGLVRWAAEMTCKMAKRLVYKNKNLSPEKAFEMAQKTMEKFLKENKGAQTCIK